MAIINVCVMYIHALGAKPRQACSYEPHRESYTTLWALLEGHRVGWPIVLAIYGYSGHVCMEIHT